MSLGDSVVRFAVVKSDSWAVYLYIDKSCFSVL